MMKPVLFVKENWILVFIVDGGKYVCVLYESIQ